MSKMVRRLIPSLLVAFLFTASSSVWAKDEIGHEEARRLVEEGKIKSLESILEALAATVPGRLLKTELENEKGRLLYDLKVLRPDGAVQEVEIDAVSGEIVKIEDND